MLNVRPFLLSSRRKKNSGFSSPKEGIKNSSIDNLNDGNGFGVNLKNELSKTEKTTQTGQADKTSLNIQNFIQEIHTYGKALSQDPTLRNFHSYKEYIKKFFNSYIGEIYKIEKVSSLDKKNFVQKEFHILKVINNELNSLLGLVQNEQLDNIKITDKVLSIKGIIINFLS